MTSPTTPALTFVFRIDADIAPPRSGGLSPRGERLHIAITGGRVSGPRLSGRILAGGSDWPLIRPDGHSEISARYTILTDDDVPILVRNDGLRVSSPETLRRLRTGEAVDPGAYYFRALPRFEAPDGPHGWLNTRLFVASLQPGRSGVRIDVYQVD